MKIIVVSGARPNYMKIAPLLRAVQRRNQTGSAQIRVVLVHTGQHYDRQLFHVFFGELGLPKPDYDLAVGSGSHAVQTGEIMIRFEPVLQKEQPDLILVVGDVNSTLACALAAVKMGLPVAHVEAGLRSFDRTMPEEINRLVTDSISDYLFTTEPSANENLRREGVDSSKIFFVGNVMIDTLLEYRERARRLPVLKTLDLSARRYGVLTLHRPNNVDQPDVFRRIIGAVERLAIEVPIVFPCHPRTAARIREVLPSTETRTHSPKLRVLEPMSYLEFLCLTDHAALVLTDSGGIQEETTILGIPCLTLRDNTERPLTTKLGTNVLVGTDPDRILAEGLRALQRNGWQPVALPLWDGKASERIVDVLITHGRAT